MLRISLVAISSESMRRKEERIDPGPSFHETSTIHCAFGGSSDGMVSQDVSDAIGGFSEENLPMILEEIIHFELWISLNHFIQV